MRISDWSSDVCSSDLQVIAYGVAGAHAQFARQRQWLLAGLAHHLVQPFDDLLGHGQELFAARRSEEHTSELQSLMRISYAVFCLKKKTKMKIKYSNFSH